MKPWEIRNRQPQQPVIAGHCRVQLLGELVYIEATSLSGLIPFMDPVAPETWSVFI
jgi:hypothetical protein